jgi:histidine ammonia-lyase
MSDFILESLPHVASNVIFPEQIIIGAGKTLSLLEANFLAKNKPLVQLSDQSRSLMKKSFTFLKNYMDAKLPIYGINTQFGDQVSLLDPHIQTENQDAYNESINMRQENLLKSHACGLGNIIDPEIIKVTMMLRAHCLAQGYSGVTQNVVTALLNFINNDIVPVVRCYGSIGASGDLIPLAMIAAALAGENVKVFFRGEITLAPRAIEMAGLQAFKPICRDGLALINGTSLMTAMTSLSLHNLRRLFTQMLAAIAMSLEAMQVIESGYDPLVHQLKNHSGEIWINQFLRHFWEGSQLIIDLDALRISNENVKSVQDYYSLRSIAQGFGPFYENLERAVFWIEEEMNSVNDNPIVDTATKKVLHAANFMGYYVLSACDMLKMDIAQASTWLHALLANLVHPRKNHHLPANLVENPGMHNGFRPLQLLAAALAVQNRKLAQCQQSFMLPTEGDNQDVNSLGTHAALDFKEAVANLERLVAIQLLAGAQALELRGIEKASHHSQKMYHAIREHSKKIAECRPMTDEIENLIRIMQEDKLGC